MANCGMTLLGVGLDCGQVGGIKDVYIVPAELILTETLGATGSTAGTLYEITTVGGATGVFKTYSFRRGNATLTSTGTITDATGTRFFKTDLNLKFNKIDKTNREELEQLLKGPMKVIVRDNNDILWYLGYNGYASITGANGNFGANFGDANQLDLTITTESLEFPYTVTAIITDLIG